jgi:hypothetical protein
MRREQIHQSAKQTAPFCWRVPRKYQYNYFYVACFSVIEAQ